MRACGLWHLLSRESLWQSAEESRKFSYTEKASQQQQVAAENMRFLWILNVLLTLLSMGLMLIIFGQHSVTSVLDKTLEKQLAELDVHARHLSNIMFYKTTLENMLVEKSNYVKNLEEQVNNVSPKVEEKRAEMDACEAERNAVSEEVARKETEQTETEANLKAESKAWTEELARLKEQLAAQSEICKYTKMDSLAQKLCGAKPTEPVQNLDQKT